MTESWNNSTRILQIISTLPFNIPGNGVTEVIAPIPESVTNMSWLFSKTQISWPIVCSFLNTAGSPYQTQRTTPNTKSETLRTGEKGLNLVPATEMTHCCVSVSLCFLHQGGLANQKEHRSDRRLQASSSYWEVGVGVGYDCSMAESEGTASQVGSWLHSLWMTAQG